MTFKDYFSDCAKDYQKFRPAYPQKLFEYLASLTSSHDLAWDCATGNGQAALGLVPHFEKVIATDASEKQINEAFKHPQIFYHVAPAEKSPLASNSVDLITVAQALHWFDFDKFYAEVKRVLKPGGILACWCCWFQSITPELDAVFEKYHAEILKDSWTPERKFVDEKYQNVPFPFQEIMPPHFEQCSEWNLSQQRGYLQTWSASQLYFKKNHRDPTELILKDLEKAWGDPKITRRVTWPIHLRIGRV